MTLTDAFIVGFIALTVILTGFFALNNANNALLDSQKKTYLNYLSEELIKYKEINPTKRLSVYPDGCAFKKGENLCELEVVFENMELLDDPNNHEYIYKSFNGIDFVLMTLISSNDYFIFDSITKNNIVLNDKEIVDGICGVSTNTKDDVPCLSGEMTPIIHDENLALLMHMDGKNDDNNFIDQTEKKASIVGDVKLKSDQKMFGTASAYFDGKSYISFDDSYDFNFLNKDFTIDFWTLIDNLEGGQVFISRGHNDFLNNSHVIIQKNEANLLDAFIRGESENIIGRIIGGQLKENNWHHVAYTRKGENFYLFLDGDLVGKAMSKDRFSGISFKLRIGAHNHDSNKSFLKGYIDELRILTGRAEWTESFTLANRKYYWYNWSCRGKKGGINALCGTDKLL